MNKNATVLNRSLNDDRAYLAERDRSSLQRSLVEATSQSDQLSSEKYGLTVALDQLRRKNRRIVLMQKKKRFFFIGRKIRY